MDKACNVASWDDDYNIKISGTYEYNLDIVVAYEPKGKYSLLIIRSVMIEDIVHPADRIRQYNTYGLKYENFNLRNAYFSRVVLVRCTVTRNFIVSRNSTSNCKFKLEIIEAKITGI